jgi:hypothetical protein
MKQSQGPDTFDDIYHASGGGGGGGGGGALLSPDPMHVSRGLNQLTPGCHNGGVRDGIVS